MADTRLTSLQAKSLAADLLAEVKRISAEQSPPAPDAGTSSGVSPSSTQPKIPQKLQRAKVADAMKMVERE
jgi:nucleoporin NUP82